MLTLFRRDPSRDRSRRRSRSPRPHYRDTRGRDYERTRELAKKYRPQAPPRAARENPEPSTVLGVFNLNYNTTEKDLEEVFSKYPSLEKTVVVVDHKASIHL
jgi:transformer-2 protein